MSLVRKIKVAAVAVAMIAPTAVFAAPISPGDYIAKDYNNNRSIWTPNGNNPSSNAFVQGNGATGLWSFSPDSLFRYTGTKARLTGRATNTGQNNLSFDFDLRFNIKNSGNTPYCQQAGAGGSHNCATTNAGIDPSDWTYFSVISATLTGVVGSHMEGLMYTLTSNPTHAPQAGEAANALDTTGTGFSMWFNWTKSGMATSPYASKYTFNKGGKGDINIDLDPDGPVGGAVPLPAAGWMLLAGLGGLAAAKRRKKS
ncbi:VPLPA-CTERM sorting domain-containing protein [uncultured Roseovarius sp.]|uniref:VPLPA-CTERM sorting domain-containing protein n=1 Tax=uncultured Roseovarius sp. TaxID=293344 RepID=UPI002631993E|nr:VPLPA-CTERM sorting domain-containing protein [uncultured Roseovarius sp.]